MPTAGIAEDAAGGAGGDSSVAAAQLAGMSGTGAALRGASSEVEDSCTDGKNGCRSGRTAFDGNDAAASAEVGVGMARGGNVSTGASAPWGSTNVDVAVRPPATARLSDSTLPAAGTESEDGGCA